MNLSELLTPAEVSFFTTQHEEAKSRLDAKEQEQVEAVRAHFAGERLQLARRVLLSVLSVSATSSDEAPVSIVVAAEPTVPVEPAVIIPIQEETPTPTETPAPTEATETPVPSPAPRTGKTITRAQLAELLGCDPTSIGNYEKKGMVTRVEGTGTKPTNPALYLAAEVPLLRSKLADAAAAHHMALKDAAAKGRTKKLELGSSGQAEASTPVKVTPPVPIIDTNEAGKWAAVDQGKATFQESKIFYLCRNTSGRQWLWDTLLHPQPPEGWDLVEAWRKTGMGRWESTPNVPGTVGAGNGIAHGPRIGSIVG